MTAPWLVAGLGNPGERFARTRHNAGAMVVERLCDRFGARLKRVRFLALLSAEIRHDAAPVLLTVPAAYMNVSGPPIASFGRKRGVPVERVIACHDDIDLSFGALRVKRGGSTAGHHGLDSLVQALGSRDFLRVRIGVGRPRGRQDPADYVLEAFTPGEREAVDSMLEDACDAVLSLIAAGLSVTQDRYNRTRVREPKGTGGPEPD